MYNSEAVYRPAKLEASVNQHPANSNIQKSCKGVKPQTGIIVFLFKLSIHTCREDRIHVVHEYSVSEHELELQ